MQLLDCTIGTPSIRKAGLSIHTGSLRQKQGSDATSKGGSVPERGSVTLSASETFTQGRRRRIGGGSPHANGSVNGVTIRPYIV